MECIGGPLDGFGVEPSLIDKNGVVVLGMVRKTYLDGVPYFEGVAPATYKQAFQAAYRAVNGKLIYVGMKR